jgi:hypothetical protein
MKYNLTIASCFRGELSYLVEWIEYHLHVGVQHFYLGNNEFDKSLAEEILQPYISRQIVSLFPIYDLSLAQYHIIPKIVEIAKDETKWLAVIDLDEFIFLQNGQHNIYEDILKNGEIKGLSAYGINWATFGCSNVVFKQKLVTQSYFKRASKDHKCNQTVKFILKPQDILSCLGHSFLFKHSVVTTDGKLLKPLPEGKYRVEETCWKFLRLNHYPIKSLEEFLEKTKRGYMGKAAMFMNDLFWNTYFSDYNRNEEKDTSMRRYAEHLEKVCTT